MTQVTNADLLRRIHELENENASLRADGDSTPRADTSRVRGGSLTKKRSWAWTLLATILIVIGSILAPVAVVSSWAKVTLTDTDRFVAAYGPLAKDPAVQAFITDETLTIIAQQIDIDKLTGDVIDGITSLGTGPAATQALQSLKGPAAQGVHTLIRSGVSAFVSSDAFATVWEQALRISHSQLVAAMQNDPNAAVALGADGSIGIQLGPIIDAVKSALVAQGLTFASQIPSVDRTITVAQSNALPTAQLGYNVAVGAGAWLPWIALLLLVAGVLVARRRSVALIWAAIALAISMAIVASAFAIGNGLFIASVSPALLPSDVAGILYNTVSGDMRTTSVSVLVLALVVAVVGWFAGPFDVPRRLRALASEGASRIRGTAERRGITTGRVGEWMFRQRLLLRVAVFVIAAVLLLFVRPLSPAIVVWTLVLATIAVAILEIVQRPVITILAETDVSSPMIVES